MSNAGRYERWAFPYFEDSAGVPFDERRNALRRLLSVKDHRIRLVAERYKDVADLLPVLLDSQADIVMTMHKLEAWWTATLSRTNVVSSGGISGLVGRLGIKSAQKPPSMAPSNTNLPAWCYRNTEKTSDLLSVIGDIAILLGESLVIRRPTYSWSVNDDRKTIRRKLPEAGQIVVMRGRTPTWEPVSFNFYWSLTRSYEQLFSNYRNSTVEFQGAYNSFFPGWDVVNAVNGFADPDP